MKQKPFTDLFEFAEGKDFSYCESKEKQKFHKLAKSALRELQRELKHEQHDVRSNMAGIAVSGEITLHTNRVYIQISKSSMGSPYEILYRLCDGIKDYTGRANHFCSIKSLKESPWSLTEMIKGLDFIR